MSLPGFREARFRGGRTVWNEAFDEDVREAGWHEPGGFEALLTGEVGAEGRGQTVEQALPRAGLSCLVRPMLHGGLFGGVLRGALRSPARAFEELRVTAGLRAAGAPVPQPVLAAARRRGPLWNALVATVREDAPDALAWLAAQPPRDRLLRGVEAAGRAIRRFHDAGGSHADLHVKNLLIHEHADRTEVVILDLDGATLGTPPDPGRRMAELARLYRSTLKRGVAHHVDLEGNRRLLAAYLDGDEALGTALARHWPRERRRVAVHALGYRGSSSRPSR